jgi:hypothetical protein
LDLLARPLKKDENIETTSPNINKIDGTFIAAGASIALGNCLQADFVLGGLVYLYRCT